MRLRIANRVFVPRLWAALVTAMLLAAFISLGAWQLARGREKQALIASFERGQRSSVALTAETVDLQPRYQHVTVSGQYDPARQVLLDNMPSQAGMPGYRVLTPLVRAGTRTIITRGPRLGADRIKSRDPAVGGRFRCGA